MLTRLKLLAALPSTQRYATAVLAVVCTLAIRLALDPWLSNRAPYLFFLLTVVLVARLWGRGPGIVSTVLGGLAAWYFVIGPRYSFAIEDRADAINLVIYFAVGVGASLLNKPARYLSASSLAGGEIIRFRFLRQTAVLAAATVVLTGMILLLWRDFGHTRDAERWVAHTYQVMNRAESLLTVIGRAETGQCGYLLTRDDHDLAPYDSALTAIPPTLQELRRLTSDNPAQQARLNEVGRLTQEKLEVMKHTLELRKTSGREAALEFVHSGQGRQLMDELRTVMDALESEEHRLLAQRASTAREYALRVRWVLGLGGAAMVILLVLASVVMERDLHRREEMTQALRRHADLLEQAHDSLLTWPLGGAINYWSHGAEILYGYTREEAVGRFSHELLATHHPLGMAHIDALVERDGQWKGELTQTTKDGRRLVVEGQWTMAEDAEGNKTVLEANRDITERKRAEADNLRLATAIEQAAESVVITDRDAVIQYVNPGFTRMTGYTRAEVLGKNPRLLKSGRHDGKFYQELWATISSGKLWRGEFINRRKDGVIYTEEATIAPVRSSGGEITHYIAIKQDVTERKRAEEVIRGLNTELEQRVRDRTAQLEAANQELEAFAHSVSHDLRAPLRGIDGWSMALLEEYGAELDSKAHTYLDRVRSEAQRLGGLIDDLLELSRITRSEMAIGRVNLSSLAETIATRLKEMHPGRRIEFLIASGLTGTGDARLLEIALSNLLDNAVKFTGPRPQARIEVGKTAGDGRSAFFVRDNGVGFDMAYAGMLFGAFQRLHRAREFPGTGIGLATVQRVIHRHGGRVWAEARLGEGATFSFTLGANT
jgi:PAS domain S-box-containing protein